MALAGGNGDGRTHAQAVKVGGRHRGVQTVGLVHYQEYGFTGAAQPVGHRLVGGGHPLAGIDQKQDAVSFLDGLPGLARHQSVQPVGLGAQAAGVHRQIGPPAQPTLAILPVAGQAGKISHQGVTGSGETVEQGRLADVRPSDQGDNGKHDCRLATGP